MTTQSQVVTGMDRVVKRGIEKDVYVRFQSITRMNEYEDRSIEVL